MFSYKIRVPVFKCPNMNASVLTTSHKLSSISSGCIRNVNDVQSICRATWRPNAELIMNRTRDTTRALRMGIILPTYWPHYGNYVFDYCFMRITLNLIMFCLVINFNLKYTVYLLNFKGTFQVIREKLFCQCSFL